jgi:F0F1-type ATP synthase epsilon subunit
MADEEKQAAPTIRQDASTGEVVQEKPADGGKPTMNIKVYAPFKVYFEGEGYSLTAVNETGPFDILPHHHNFLCMLVPCDLVVKTPTETKTIKISRALMHVKAEKVTVFVDV